MTFRSYLFIPSCEHVMTCVQVCLQTAKRVECLRNASLICVKRADGVPVLYSVHVLDSFVQTGSFCSRLGLCLWNIVLNQLFSSKGKVTANRRECMSAGTLSHCGIVEYSMKSHASFAFRTLRVGQTSEFFTSYYCQLVEPDQF